MLRDGKIEVCFLPDTHVSWGCTGVNGRGCRGCDGQEPQFCVPAASLEARKAPRLCRACRASRGLCGERDENLSYKGNGGTRKKPRVPRLMRAPSGARTGRCERAGRPSYKRCYALFAQGLPDLADFALKLSRHLFAPSFGFEEGILRQLPHL